MTITIDLPDDPAARLADMRIPTADATRYAMTALEEGAERAEVRAWWDGLLETARVSECRKTNESLAAADAGCTDKSEDVYERVRTRNKSGIHT